MKFKKGDAVRFLNDVGGGVVNRVDDRGLVYVLTEDGFEIPVADKELVFSRNLAYTKDQDQREEEPVIKPEKAKIEKPMPVKAPEIPANLSSDAKIEIFLGFIPEMPGPVFASRIVCYLINDSPYFMQYMVGKKEGGVLQYITSGSIEADTKAFLITLDQTAISKISDIHVQLLFVSKGRYVRREPVDTMMHLNLVNFSKESYYRDNEYFEEKAVLFNLAGKPTEKQTDFMVIPEEIKEIKLQADVIPARPKKREPSQDTLEVDLHFEEDAAKNSQLTPSAIMALQMSRFHSAIEEAISRNLKRLVIIHGLGQGTLKLQIRKELQEKYPKFIYQDASFKEYGFGATMVHLTFDQKQ